MMPTRLVSYQVLPEDRAVRFHGSNGREWVWFARTLQDMVGQRLFLQCAGEQTYPGWHRLQRLAVDDLIGRGLLED
jgi:hypothetical protein